MAFNKTENQDIIQSGFITSSRGTDANRAYGELFSGAANTLQNSLQAYDASIRTQIEIDAMKAVETATDPASYADRKISKLKNARSQGAVTDAEYYTKLADISKSTRTKIPEGYHPVLEDALSAASGQSTANKQRMAELEAEREAAASANSETKARQSFLAVQGNNEKLFSDQGQKLYKDLTGSNFDPQTAELNDMVSVVGTMNAVDYERDNKLKMVQYRRDTAKPVVAEFVSGKVKEAMSKANPLYTAFGEKFGAARNKSGPGGEVVTREEGQQMLAVFASLKADVRQKALSSIRNSDIPGVSDMPASAIQDIMAGIDAELGAYEAIITSPTETSIKILENESNLAKATIQSKLAKANGPLMYQEILKINPDIKPTLDAYLGKELMPSGKGTYQDNLNQTLYGLAMSSILTGDYTLDGAIKEMGTEATSEAKKAVIDNITSLISNPDLTPEEAAVYAPQIFSKENEKIIEQYASKDRIGMFRRFVNPEVTKKLQGTDAFDTYATWANKQANVLLQASGDLLIDSQKSSQQVYLKFDGTHISGDTTKIPWASDKLIGSLDPTGMVSTALKAWEVNKASLAQKQISTFNQYVDQMLPVWEAQGVSDTSAAILNVIGQNPELIKKEGNFVSQIFRAVGQFGKEEETPKTKTGSDKQGAASPNILDFIQKAEGSGYNTMFGGMEADLLDKPVSDVLAFNKAHGRKTGSSATGAYQVMHDTLKDLVKAGIVDETDLFDKDTQDKIAVALMNKAGMKKYLAGKLSKDAFADNLAGVWASLPLSDGKSRYHGDSMNNRATVSRKQLLDAIDTLG